MTGTPSCLVPPDALVKVRGTYAGSSASEATPDEADDSARDDAGIANTPSMHCVKPTVAQHPRRHNPTGRA